MKPSQFVDALEPTLQASDFSGVVLLRQQGQTLFEHAAGYADRSNRLMNTRTTRFGVASGTKVFTALAIAQLIAAKKLSLATRLEECLDLTFSHYAPEISVQHLLSHTSGIPDFFDEDVHSDVNNFFINRPWYEMRRLRDYLAVFPDEPMKFSPGTAFSYSNGGYILLGLIVEELTGMTYQDYVEEALFQAIGMSRSGFYAFNQLPEHTALGYIEHEGQWRSNIYNLPIVGASDGGAYSTVDDLSIFWQALLEHQIVASEVLEQFISPHVKASASKEIYYGHGFWLREGSLGQELYITGYDAGVSFWSGMTPASGLEVSVIANTTEGAWPVVKAMYGALAG